MDKVRFNTAEGAAGEAASYVSHRIHSPRMLERNPYQPDEADVWTAWTDTELDARGARLYSAETMFDSQGRLRATRAAKKTRIGEPATKMAYTIVGPAGRNGGPPGAGWAPGDRA